MLAVAAITGTTVVTLGGAWTARVRMPREAGESLPSGTPEQRPSANWTDYLTVVSVPVGALPRHVRGRDDILRALQRQHRRGGIAVLVGVGGSGKSTIAHELARQAQAPRRGKPGSLCWQVSGADHQALLGGLLTIARQLGVDDSDLQVNRDMKPVAPDCLWKALHIAPRGWLLIIDNADEPRLLDPPAARGDSARLRNGTG